MEKFLDKIKLSVRKNLPACFLIFFVICVNIFFILFYKADGRIEIGDQMAYHTLASNIKNFATFGERYQVTIPGVHLFHTMPSGTEISTTFRPPGFPAFLAFLYLISENYYFVVVVQSLLAIFSFFLFYKLVKKYFGNKIALISGGLYAILPAFYQLNVSFWSESFTQSVLIVAIYLFLTGKKVFQNLILPSLLFSLVVLSRPNYAIYILAIPLLFFVNYQRKKVFDKRYIWIFAIVMIPILVWSIRCSIVTKKPVIISSTTGINFFLSNNPYVINGRASTWPTPEYLTQNGIDTTKNDYNDAVLNSMTMKSGLKWIKQNPLIFLKLIPDRIRYFFAPVTSNFMPRGVSGQLPKFVLNFSTIWSVVFCYILFFFSIIGAWFFRQKKLLLWFLPYLAVIVLTYPDNRYFFPFLLPLTILAAFGISNFKKAIKNRLAIFFAIVLICLHFSFFAPDLYRQFALFSDNLKKYVDLVNFSDKNSDKLFLTDSIDYSKNPNVIIKKSPVDNQEFYSLVSNGKTLSEDEVVAKINSGKVFTDLLNPFSGLDKKIYPNIADKNNLSYQSFDKKSIFKIIDNYQKIGDSKIYYSDQPSQKYYLDDVKIDTEKNIKFEVDFSSKGQVVICDNKKKNCFGFLEISDIDNFSVNINIDSNQLPKIYNGGKIAIKNDVNFGQPNNYNTLYTGNRAYFNQDGLRLKISTSK